MPIPLLRIGLATLLAALAGTVKAQDTQLSFAALIENISLHLPASTEALSQLLDQQVVAHRTLRYWNINTLQYKTAEGYKVRVAFTPDVPNSREASIVRVKLNIDPHECPDAKRLRKIISQSAHWQWSPGAKSDVYKTYTAWPAGHYVQLAVLRSTSCIASAILDKSTALRLGPPTQPKN